jgi:thiol-disulfide isomerase/thioredoxin
MVNVIFNTQAKGRCMMSKRFAWKAFTAMAFVLGLAIILRAGDVPDDWTFDDDPAQRQAHAKLEGKPMPKLELGSWINGEVKPEDLKGKVVVVDLFATWCGPCIRLVPHNNELIKKYKDQGMVLFGICTSESGQDQLEQTAKDNKIEYSVAKDPDLKAQKAWAVQYYPTYAVIDRNGVVRVVGLNPEHLEELVKKLLAEKPGEAAPKK